MLTVSYFDTDRFIADPESDPLCQMLAAEDELDEIAAMIETQLAWAHVKPVSEFKE